MYRVGFKPIRIWDKYLCRPVPTATAVEVATNFRLSSDWSTRRRLLKALIGPGES